MYDNKLGTQRCWAVCYIIAAGLLVFVTEAKGRPPQITGGGGVTNVVRELDVGLPVRTRLEVYADTLRQMPIVFMVHLSVRSADPNTVAFLERSGRRWYEEFQTTVLKDGQLSDAYRIELIPDSERIERLSPAGSGDPGFYTDVPDTLSAELGVAVYTLWELVGPHGSQLESGVYDVSIRSLPDFRTFFGLDGGFGGGVHIFVKEREDGDDDRHTEDLIERHYLWAVTLYKFDRAASKKEFGKGWNLVQQYLRSGAGDEPGLYNLTPRYQAYTIAKWLDKNRQAVSYLSEVLSKNAGSAECNMRYYHFRREQGHMLRNQAGDLAHRLNQMYEQVYGKTMRGEPVTRLPVRRNFPIRKSDGARKAP